MRRARHASLALVVLLVSAAQAGRAAPTPLSAAQQSGAAPCTIEQVGAPIPGAAPVGIDAVVTANGAFVARGLHDGDRVETFGVDFNAPGDTLRLVSGASLPNGPSAVAFTADARYLVATTLRGNDLTVYGVDPASGQRTLVGSTTTGGNGPVNVAVGRNNRVYVVNADSNSLGVFQLDPLTGALRPEGVVPLPVRPIDVKVVESGGTERVVIGHAGANEVRLYEYNPRDLRDRAGALRDEAAQFESRGSNREAIALRDAAALLEAPGLTDRPSALRDAAALLEAANLGGIADQLRDAAAQPPLGSPQVAQLDPAGWRQEGRVTGVATAGNQIAVGAFNGTVYRLALTGDGQLNRIGSFTTGGDITDLTFTPGGNHLVVTGGLPGGVRVFDYESLASGDIGSVQPACSVSAPDRVSRTVATLPAAEGATIIVNEFRPGNRTTMYSVGLRSPVTLDTGCSQVTPAVTEAAAAYAARVTPQGALVAIWEHQAANNTFRGWSPAPGAPDDLAGVTRLRPTFVCTADAATLDASATTGPPTPAANLTAGTPTPPNRLHGTAMVGGEPAAPGTSIQASVGTQACGETTVEAGGAYVVDVASAASQTGCGTDGATITFTVGGTRATQTATWRQGAITAQPLTAGPASSAAQEDEDAAFVAGALGVPQASVRLDGPLNPVAAADARLFRVGGGEPGASPGLAVQRAAYARLERYAQSEGARLLAGLDGSGGALDCARPTVACPVTELRTERFEDGGALFVWDLAGAVERPAEGETLRIAVLAYDPRFPRLTDARPNSPFAGVNKVWVLELTATEERVRYFQVDGGQLREFRTDAIAGFSADRGFSLIAGTAFAGVTAYNMHTYLLGRDEEGGHALVSTGSPLIPVNGPMIQLAPAPPEPCAPRPPVRVSVARQGEGVLQVTVTAGAGALTGLEVKDGPNWTIEPAAPIQVLDGATELTFRIRRTGPGAVAVPFTVTDGCGAWPTFAGGGPSAF
jgi:hypothetical protein